MTAIVRDTPLMPRLTEMIQSGEIFVDFRTGYFRKEGRLRNHGIAFRADSQDVLNRLFSLSLQFDIEELAEVSKRSPSALESLVMDIL